jgi:hypothetical protein
LLGPDADFRNLAEDLLAEGMTSFLFERRIRIFDYPKFAEPFRNRIRENAERMAAEAGIEIEFIRKRNLRKEDRVKETLEKRGEYPGLVCISPPWNPARPTSHGTTGRLGRRILFRMRASAAKNAQGSNVIAQSE